MKYELKNGWTKDVDKEIVFKFSEGYKSFLTQCKTERESVKEVVRLAEECGFKPLESYKTLKEGDKVYAVNKLRSIYLAVIGRVVVAATASRKAANASNGSHRHCQNFKQILFHDKNTPLFDARLAE